MKDFEKWNKNKKVINNRKNSIYYYEREIRWCNLGVNIGFEQDGTGKGFSRPVLILKAFSRTVCLIVPLTTSLKDNPYHFLIGEIQGKKSFAIFSQLRLIDTKRLQAKVNTLKIEIFEQLKKAIKDML